MTMSKIAVYGGAGALGRVLVHFFKEKGWVSDDKNTSFVWPELTQRVTLTATTYSLLQASIWSRTTLHTTMP